MSRNHAALVCSGGAAALLITLLLLLAGTCTAAHDPGWNAARPERCRLSDPRAGAAGPDLAAARGLHASPAISSDGKPLAAGLDALGRGWPVMAYRRCQEAAAANPEQVAALLCQGRAALQLGWPQRAAFLAQRALALRESAEAYLLLGDAFEVLRDCRSARPAYLRALEMRSWFPEAEHGLRRCGVDLPPPWDLRADQAQARFRGPNA